MVTDEPVHANLRVGLMLEALDKLSEDVALRFARSVDARAKVVTAAIDEMKVHHAPEVTEDVVLRARINLVGRTSMEVGIRVEQAGEKAIHLASCYFTMVARVPAADVDGEGEGEQGLILPALHPNTAKDERRAVKARERRSNRSNADATEAPTAEEYQVLRTLHSEQDKPGQNLLLATAVTTQGWERTYPEHENVPQTIFGGYVAHRAYMYAHICAEMVATHRALLVSVDRINFYQPVRMGDKLHFMSRVTYTGKTSMTVETEITRISRDRSMTALSNTCIFTFVNVDAELNAIAVPQVYPTTYAEDARFLHAYRRRQRYKGLVLPNGPAARGAVAS